MKKTCAIFVFAVVAMAVSVVAAPMTTVTMKLSGPGAVNDSTIKAGQKVSLDLYFAAKQELRAVSFGFRLYSPDIKAIQHVPDTAKGLTEVGDIKGANGWNDFTKWDFLNRAVLKNWDGALPDTLGFVAAVAKKKYLPHEVMKVYSIDIVAPGPGTIVMDTAFYEPGGSFKAILAPNGPEGAKQDERPLWKGPYKFKVVQ
jgi:hypothetical protein